MLQKKNVLHRIVTSGVIRKDVANKVLVINHLKMQGIWGQFCIAVIWCESRCQLQSEKNVNAQAIQAAKTIRTLRAEFSHPNPPCVTDHVRLCRPLVSTTKNKNLH